MNRLRAWYSPRGLVVATLFASWGCTGAVTAPAPSHAAATQVAASTAGVRWLGRVDAHDPTAVNFAWSGSGLLATVKGRKVSVRLRTDEGSSGAFFQPVLDGVPGPRFQVPSGTTQTIVLGEGLADGPHRVELYRESEGWVGPSTFLGFVDGQVVGAPASPTRLLEVIGDSISAGYGSLGHDVHPPWDKSCRFSLDTESAYVTYGALLGRAFDAEVSILARSGWGIYRDRESKAEHVLPAIYGNTLGASDVVAYDFARQPDAVIINLGTNDSAPGDPGEPYEDAYVAFLKTLRAHYPKAWVFLTIGPMTGEPLLSQMRAHLDHVVARANDPKVVTVPLETQDVSTTGCDYHPDVDEHQRMATALAAVFHSKLGW